MRPDVELSVERAVDAARAGSVDRSALPAEIRKRIREALGRNFRAYPSIMPLITIMGDRSQTEDKSSSRAAGKRKRGRPAGIKRSSARSVKLEVPE
jgi:hypothetical protein